MTAFDSITRAACACLVLCAAAANAQTFVQITEEPSHQLKLSTAKYRVWFVELPAGAETLFHEHRADNFTIVLSDTEIDNQKLQSAPMKFSTRTGSVSFAAASYVHKVRTTGAEPFRNLTVEMLLPATQGSHSSGLDGVAGVSKMREFARGASYVLDGASTVRIPAATGDLFIACTAPAALAITVQGASEQVWNCKVGEFRLFGRGSPIALRRMDPSQRSFVLVSAQ